MPSHSRQRTRQVVTRKVHQADIIIDRTLRSAEKRGLPPQVRYTMNAFDKKAKKALKYAEKKVQQNMQSSQQSPYQHLAAQYPPPPDPPSSSSHHMGSTPPPPPGYPSGNGGAGSSSKPHKKHGHSSSSGYPQGTKLSSKHPSKYSSHNQKPPKGYPKPPKGYPKHKKYGQGHGYPPPPQQQQQQYGNGKPSLQGKITSKLSDPTFQAQAIKFVKKKVAKELINGFSSY